ncbi:hypothetical protein ACOSP7_007168 [Xanthoceras sorbifolium]|uniref:Protein high chlorophyll fluorescent 107 n=1 Tax=Xanthoceras sorbifolium TaxID=99658 RepID=A0ABQ8IAB8_9ROSI|nr:hypothetical protein JRO89_XS03G0155600 [Xanthoceras sorbifolium]
MNLFISSSSSSSSKPNFTLFTASQNPNNKNPSKHPFKVPYNTTRHPPSLSLAQCSSHQTTQVLVESPSDARPTKEFDAGVQEEEKALVVRRPVKEVSVDGSGEVGVNSTAFIDDILYEFAKKFPIFEPERVEFSAREKPLTVNLDLALYKAKNLTRNYRYLEAQEILEKCINCWPEDGRPYVALGKILGKQSKAAEARAVYAQGCEATQGENAFIWQCWAVLENKIGNIRKARELFDAATLVDKKHIAAWHGWAVLELKQGNIKKARHLLAKGLKFCGGNEYIYQTLALLEARADRYEQARNLFRQATKCNAKSCASWLSWAQMEMQQKNNLAARKLFERAVQASPKNRFAWHVWGVFEANRRNFNKARKLLKIGHALNPRDPVLLQSLGLLEYKYSTANIARSLFRKASLIDPRHQPVWIAWGWMEWKEGNLSTAREFYQRALAIDTTTESAARCLQAWGVLEQRVGNLSAARRLFRSSLNINSQSYVTWMTLAQLEEDQGNSVRAEEIRNQYFQQRIEVVDDASWVMGFMDIINPALDSIKRLFNLQQNSFKEPSRYNPGVNENVTAEESVSPSFGSYAGNDLESVNGFDLDKFIREKLSLDPEKLDVYLAVPSLSRRIVSPRRIFRSSNKKAATLLPQTNI